MKDGYHPNVFSGSCYSDDRGNTWSTGPSLVLVNCRINWKQRSSLCANSFPSCGRVAKNCPWACSTHHTSARLIKLYTLMISNWSCFHLSRIHCETTRAIRNSISQFQMNVTFRSVLPFSFRWIQKASINTDSWECDLVPKYGAVESLSQQARELNLSISFNKCFAIGQALCLPWDFPKRPQGCCMRPSPVTSCVSLTSRLNYDEDWQRV